MFIVRTEMELNLGILALSISIQEGPRSHKRLFSVFVCVAFPFLTNFDYILSFHSLCSMPTVMALNLLPIFNINLVDQNGTNTQYI